MYITGNLQYFCCINDVNFTLKVSKEILTSSDNCQSHS